MKYGTNFETQSVPHWIIHNIDYNSLKQQIKIHTTRNQATAIAIPGRTNQNLRKFEEDFYEELVRQHDRVGLFVNAKADGLGYQLQHLDSCVQALIARCRRAEASKGKGLSSKRTIKLARYQQQVVECREGIRDLERFVQAQAEAFRKILKKYRKWTGSTTLGTRFNDDILSNPKGFIRRDFNELHNLVTETRRSIADTLTKSPSADDASAIESELTRPGLSRATTSRSEYQSYPQHLTCWNEYDHGSEAGGDDDYTLYIDLNNANPSSGKGMIHHIITSPAKKIRSFFSSSSTTNTESERRALLGPERRQPDYSSLCQATNNADSDAEGTDVASSLDIPASGYAAHYAALPSIEDQRMIRFKEKVLHRAMFLAYFVSIILLFVSGILVTTGRHKLRLEVDAGVTVAVSCSYVSAVMGLWAMLNRQDSLSYAYQLLAWFSFIGICLLNGMLLVVVVCSQGI